VLIDLQQKPADFTAMYARACADDTMSAKVPMLEVDGAVLIESMVILEYLEDLTGTEASLSAAARARARLFATLAPQWLSMVAILRADAQSDDEAAAVAKCRTGLRSLNDFLVATPTASSEAGPFLLGSSFSLAEAACAPFVQRFFTVLPALRPAIDPRNWLVEDGLDRLNEWADAVRTRPSCIETLPADAVLVDGYARLIERMKAMAAAK